jgi:hypothetical protein
MYPRRRYEMRIWWWYSLPVASCSGGVHDRLRRETPIRRIRKNPLSTWLLDSLVYNSIIGAGMSPVKGGNEYVKIDTMIRI